MPYNEIQLFDLAVEITKEYARGGGDYPDVKLISIFEALKEINQKT